MGIIFFSYLMRVSTQDTTLSCPHFVHDKAGEVLRRKLSDQDPYVRVIF
jgi:hypothetical protein